MVDTLIVPRRHHSGLDANKSTITGLVGETYASTDSNKFYYWNVPLAAWKTGEGYEFVERLANAVDFDKTAFTCNGALHVDGLDLSAIVPVGAIAVKLRVRAEDDAAGSTILLRRDAGSGQNIIDCRPPVANIKQTQIEDISIESDRKLDYTCSNLVFTTIEVTVLGWYI